MEGQSKKIPMIIALAAVFLIVTFGLLWLAKGSSYELSVVDPIKGSEDAVVVIEEFSDFQCPFCADSAPKIAAALKEFPTQAKLVYRDFPLPQHNQARAAALGALCAAQQEKFPEYHDAVFVKQDTWASPNADPSVDYFEQYASELGLNLEDWNACRESRDARDEVQRDVKEGTQRGISSTPSFFINGKPLAEIPVSTFAWIQVIEAELERQGVAPENAQDEMTQEDTIEENS